jgi:hypothetical protein
MDVTMRFFFLKVPLSFPERLGSYPYPCGLCNLMASPLTFFANQRKHKKVLCLQVGHWQRTRFLCKFPESAGRDAQASDLAYALPIRVS